MVRFILPRLGFIYRSWSIARATLCVLCLVAMGMVITLVLLMVLNMNKTHANKEAGISDGDVRKPNPNGRGKGNGRGEGEGGGGHIYCRKMKRRSSYRSGHLNPNPNPRSRRNARRRHDLCSKHGSVVPCNNVTSRAVLGPHIHNVTTIGNGHGIIDKETIEYVHDTPGNGHDARDNGHDTIDHDIDVSSLSSDYDDDPHNCGGCGNVCGPLSPTCCGGHCTHLSNDPLNCGLCGHSCTYNSTCFYGMCNY